jgi:hypothetical protein
VVVGAVSSLSPASPVGQLKPSAMPPAVAIGATEVGATGLAASCVWVAEGAAEGAPEETWLTGRGEMDAVGTAERVSLVGIGAKIPDADGMMSEVGTAGRSVGATSAEETAGTVVERLPLLVGTGTTTEVALLCAGVEDAAGAEASPLSW